MIKFGTTVIPGNMEWMFAIEGMRNPMDSWAKSDSTIDHGRYVKLGENDLGLMKRLIAAGTEHRKFLRQLTVWLTITAPRYWWTEMDTYKIGTTRNSCSTVHRITAKDFTRDDFSMDGLEENELDGIIAKLNTLRGLYVNATDSNLKKSYWRKIIMLLPQCYNQKASMSFTMETLLNIYFQRRNHRITEWHEFCDYLLTIPYFKEFVDAASTDAEEE